MVAPELPEELKTVSVDERTNLIKVILRSLKHDTGLVSRRSIAENRSLRGKVHYYEGPYEPVADTDWEAST